MGSKAISLLSMGACDAAGSCSGQAMLVMETGSLQRAVDVIRGVSEGGPEWRLLVECACKQAVAGDEQPHTNLRSDYGGGGPEHTR